MKQLVIFDLDGTLINSIKDLGAATNFALEKNGFPTHPLEAYPMYVGNGVSKLIERALPEDQRNEAMIKKIRADFTTYYDIHNTDYTNPYDGIPELLEHLQENGIKIAVASNKYDAAAKALVTTLFPSISFAAIEGQKEGVPVKPDPSVVFEILGATQVKKADVLYVGDSGVDMETARRACVDSVGVTWGFRSVDELRANYANHIVDTPEEIIPLLD